MRDIKITNGKKNEDYLFTNVKEKGNVYCALLQIKQSIQKISTFGAQ